MQKANVEQVLAQYEDRLLERMRLTLASEETRVVEDSDTYLLLNTIFHRDESDQQKLITEFEQSGRWLAEQGGQLEARLNVLYRCVAALLSELKPLLPMEVLPQIVEHLYQLQSVCTCALVRGYQEVNDRYTQERISASQIVERRLITLQRINGVSNSTIDLDQTLEIIAQIIAEELHVELCSIFFYDELQRVLTLRATNGPKPLGGMHFTLRLGEGYSGLVADKGRPLIVRDVLTDENFASEAHAYGIDAIDLRGLMALPIIFFGNAERLIGVMSIQSHEPRDFTPEEISFVEVVAGIIAINIENGRLYEQTDEQLRRKVHELATIHRVSSIIASTLNLDEVLQIITTQAVHLSGAERSCIFELDPGRQRLQALAQYGLNSDITHSITVGVGQCCAGRSVQTGRPSMAVDCVQNDEHCFLHDDPFLSSEVHSVLCVPLKVKQKILGCICVYSSHRHLLSPEQMQLVVTFANEAAIAIENARLYQETRRGLELKSVLLRELHHRVKNNLATVAGILSLQRRRTRSEEVRHTLAESVNRVQGLAATHDLLAHEDVSEARLDEVARKIVGVASANLSPPDAHITFQVEASSIIIPSRAVAILALVINEMVSNAIKHGMAGETEGSVTVRGYEEHRMVIVQVIDTGKKALPEVVIEGGGESSSFEGLGLSLIKHLMGDLEGVFSLRREPVVWRTERSDHEEEQQPSSTMCTVAEVRFPLVKQRR